LTSRLSQAARQISIRQQPTGGRRERRRVARRHKQAAAFAGDDDLDDTIDRRPRHRSLARQRLPQKAALRAKSRAEAESWENVDRALFERLRAVRLEIARTRGVPPYVIFHDATLREMARLRPTSLDALLTVKGVGARKADDLGETFLMAIRSPA